MLIDQVYFVRCAVALVVEGVSAAIFSKGHDRVSGLRVVYGAERSLVKAELFLEAASRWRH